MTERDPEAARQLAERVRRACVDALRAAYEEAGMSGLCEAGRWEAALSAVERLDAAELAEGSAPAKPSPRDSHAADDPLS